MWQGDACWCRTRCSSPSWHGRARSKPLNSAYGGPTMQSWCRQSRWQRGDCPRTCRARTAKDKILLYILSWRETDSFYWPPSLENIDLKRIVFPSRSPKAPYVVDTVLMGLCQGFDVFGRDGIEQQDLSLFAGHSQDRPVWSRHTNLKTIINIQEEERVDLFGCVKEKIWIVFNFWTDWKPFFDSWHCLDQDYWRVIKWKDNLI